MTVRAEARDQNTGYHARSCRRACVPMSADMMISIPIVSGHISAVEIDRNIRELADKRAALRAVLSVMHASG
ncbi:hypothetical protein PSP6_370102 [Paraburkholderia tropica]|nr:hypothetical protein PSP6_370102 [Paraburkholderia tropica]